MRLLTCLAIMVNNSYVVSNTTCNSHIDYMSHYAICAIRSVTDVASASGTNICSILRFWRKCKIPKNSTLYHVNTGILYNAKASDQAGVGETTYLIQSIYFHQ